ncbi:MAG: ATG16 family protein [Methylacidiphilales bacterium]|nr:ATG16 family protein [Candidatus Methylacidiphilales bacterium]MDW8349085.1 hypothetical protein [Verrucomicrobiae bacterium]
MNSQPSNSEPPPSNHSTNHPATHTTIHLALNRPLFYTLLTLITTAILGLGLYTHHERQERQRIWEEAQRRIETETLLAQARSHTDRARAFSDELITRHATYLAATQSRSIDLAFLQQLYNRTETALQEAEKLISKVDTLYAPTQSSQKKTPQPYPDSYTSLQEEISQQRAELKRLDTLLAEAQRHHASLQEKETEAQRLAEEKARAEQLALEKKLRETEAQLAAAQAQALPKATPAPTEEPAAVPAVEKKSQLSEAPWRPAPPATFASRLSRLSHSTTPSHSTTIIVDRVIAPPPLFCFEPIYHWPTCKTIYAYPYPLSPHYTCPFSYPHRRVRGGISIGVTIPIR